MQRILAYECPIVVCYENYFLSAYRTDRFTGFVNDALEGVPCWWTNYRASPMDLIPENPLRISTLDSIESFNFMLDQVTPAILYEVSENIYDSLIHRAPDGTDMPWLAQSYYIQTHEDDPSVANDTTRIVFTIIENATWSDGTPLTAADVVFTMNFYRDAPGNLYGADLDSLSAAYNRSQNEVVFEFDSTSYWHLHTIGYKPILPMHIFRNIPIENWTQWDPDPADEPMITSGPFSISAFTPGEFLELSRNHNYFFTPYADMISTATSDSNSGNQDIFSIISPQHLFITIPSVIVIVVVLVKWKLARLSMKFDSN